MQQFYYHQQYISNGLRQNIKTVKVQNQSMLCLTNDNSIQFYEHTANGLSHHSRHGFKANLVSLQVLPSKHHSTDFIFLLDNIGRYSFWQIGGEHQLIQNTKIQVNDRSNLYNSEEQTIFSGQTHYFDVHDTKGSLFYNIGHTIVVIDYTINLLGIRRQKVKKIDMLYIKFRHLGWVSHNQHGKLFGVIQQIDERTILRVHNLQLASKLNQQNSIFKYQKTNLKEMSITSNHEIVLLTDSEIILLAPKSYTVLATHKIHSTQGKIIQLNNIYGFIGHQLILFNKEHTKCYGALQQSGKQLFKGQGILEVSHIQELSDGGNLISISTFSHNIYLIVLYQNIWTLYHQIKAITPIFSIHPTSNYNTLVVVTNHSIDNYQVAVIQKQSNAPILREQIHPFALQRLFCVGWGERIVVGGMEGNCLMKFQNQTKQYVMQCQLSGEKILAVNEYYLVTESSVQIFDKTDQLFKMYRKQNIFLVDMKGSTLVYLNSEGEVHRINTEQNISQIIRKNIINQYCWHLLQNLDLVTVSIADKQIITIYRGSIINTQITLKQKTIISSIYSIALHHEQQQQELLVVGYINGHIHIYNCKGEILAQFDDYGCSPVTFFSIRSNMLGVVSGSRQFILKNQNNKFQLIKVSFSSKDYPISCISFLPNTNQFIFSQQGQTTSKKIIKMMALSDLQLGNSCITDDCSYRIHTICQFHQQIPIVHVKGGFVFVGIKECFSVFDLASGRLINKQSNFIKQVIGIQQLPEGLMLYGIDLLQRNTLLIFDGQNLQLLSTIAIILKDNKYIKTIKAIPNSNHIICRGQKFTTIYEISQGSAIQISEFKTDTQGYSLDINAENQLLALTDTFRLITLYSYQNGILPVARHVTNYQINDFMLMQKCIFYGDKGGQIGIVQYNLQNPNEVIRLLMTKVASISIGQQISVMTKITNQHAYYGTVLGKIGQLKIITEADYRILKDVEILTYNNLHNRCDFHYLPWRNRNPIDDKLIDSTLIKQYLKLNSKRMLVEEQQSIYDSVTMIYKQIN